MLDIHCQGCGVGLRVPAEASGRSVRCPKCRTKFRVQAGGGDLNETVCSWLVEDTEKARLTARTVQSHIDRLTRSKAPSADAL